MQYRTLGKTGMKVSSLCFGTMSFGGAADEAASMAMFRRCREVGINFFDCADVYNKGLAEEILGKCIAGIRNDVILTSKVHGKTGEGINDRGLSRRYIMLAVEESLKRLGTDRIELYFVHAFDSEADMEEILRAMDDLQRQGKILHPAVSNWAAWQIAKALGISARESLARFECIQPMYNLVKRQAEVEILPMAQSERMGVISYSPLGGGLLTGKYGVGRKPELGRLVEQANYKLRYADAGYYETADRFTRYADEHGVHPVSLAVAWVMSHPGITAPIIGARSVEQLEPSLGALNIDMTPEWRKEISALSPEPPLATDRSEEAAHSR
ncbi:aldo/keto reductase [Paenibacillus naphthalenovorans]|uniref:Aldo/keto reductase n=1 Tax=Paenibacillus naphthalenovorans TaxID=162209 RepID=A0A0U2W684_9BACL|nr:aldo/keto reductase [Paenibacillus naphthalenovorans]ALS22925.1 aldo/keto reductase [Paenibacillus naphthalenovorans]